MECFNFLHHHSPQKSIHVFHTKCLLSSSSNIPQTFPKLKDIVTTQELEGIVLSVAWASWSHTAQWPY